MAYRGNRSTGDPADQKPADQKGASIRPSNYGTRPDWIARLKRQQYGGLNPRSEVVTVYNLPEHLMRWLGVFGTEAGKSLQEAAAFALEQGCSTLLSLEAVDEIERARDVVERLGTTIQYQGLKTLSFKPTVPKGYGYVKKVSFRVPKTVMDKLTVLQKKLRLQPEALAILVVLVDVTVLPGEARELLYADAKEFIVYLRECAKEASALARQVKRKGVPRGSELSMNDLLGTAKKPRK